MISSFLRGLSPRDRRALFWGSAIVAGALAFAFVVKPYFRALAETRADLTVQRGLLARERAVVAESNVFPAVLQRSQTALAEQSPPLFDGSDELAATSDLSDHISNAALSNKVLVQQLETRKAEPLENGLVSLGVDVRAEGDFEGVLRFLNALERGDKLVKVSALVLTRVDRPVAEGVPDMEVLAVTGTLTGYALFLPEDARIADTASLMRTAGP